MYHSRFTSVNYSGNQYRDLSRYYGILPGQVGTVTGSNGETQSIPIPAFAPPMSQQTVPTYHVDYIGTPMDLMHGLRADELTSGYFPVNNAYSSACTTFRKRGCDGVVPQSQIPIPDRCPGCSGPAGLAPCPCGPGPIRRCDIDRNSIGTAIVGDPQLNPFGMSKDFKFSGDAAAALTTEHRSE